MIAWRTTDRHRGRTTLLDRTQATPLYHQIYLALRDEIVSGVRASGDALPTERELAARHDVSRITARRALDELAKAGLADRKRRTGTRVAFRSPSPVIEADIDQAVEALLAFGRETQVSVLELVEEAATTGIAAALDLSAGDRVVRAVRLRALDGVPLGRVTSWLPAQGIPPVALGALASTPMLALLKAAGLAIGAARQTIGAGAADPALAALLGIELRAPVLWIERLVRDTDGRPVLLTRADYRADRYRVTIDLNTDGTTAAPDLLN